VSAPAVDGWFTTEKPPHLLGTRCRACGTYAFPPGKVACPNPVCTGGPDELELVPLSRTGRVWSYTENRYPPPAPYVAADPFVPFTVAAVELAEERMIVLGQVVAGVAPDSLHIGDEVELVIDTLYEDDEGEHVVWKWAPV